MVLAWAAGLGPHVVHYQSPPDPNSSFWWTDLNLSWLEVGAVVLAFLVGAAWSLRRARRQKVGSGVA